MPHRRDNDDNLVAGFAAGKNSTRHILEMRNAGDGCTTIFLNE